MKVSYNEQDNVTCTGCGWHVGGSWNYLWQKNASAALPGPPAPPPPRARRRSSATTLTSPGTS